ADLPVTPVSLSSSSDPTSGRRTARRGRAYHRGVSYARDERTALCALLGETGPGAPTLCEGWRTGDLAAHLVMRERRPDAAAGLLGGPLAGHTRRVAPPHPLPAPGGADPQRAAAAVGLPAPGHGRTAQPGGVLRPSRGRTARRGWMEAPGADRWPGRRSLAAAAGEQAVVPPVAGGG